jgi:hypothetical protein
MACPRVNSVKNFASNITWRRKNATDERKYFGYECRIQMSQVQGGFTRTKCKSSQLRKHAVCDKGYHLREYPAP